MAVPSRRLRAGAREIRNREMQQAHSEKDHKKKDVQINQDEHEERIRKLKEAGLLK